jgi:predicted dehydrogenase
VSIRFERDARTMFGEGDFRYSMEDVLLVDMSIHHMDMLRAITGGRAARVYAQSWHIPQGHFAHHPAAAVLLMLDDGVPVTYTGNWATNAPETSWNGDWEIVGEEGRIAWTDTRDGSPRVMLQRWDGDPAPVEPVALAETGQAGLLADFGHAVRTGTVPDTAAADNIHSLAIVFAAVASARSGQVVEPGISGDGPAGAHGGL